MRIRAFHGVVNGKIIELNDDPGVPPGQHVEVVVKPVSAAGSAWGEGLRRCAGALAKEWSAADDQILENIYRDRKHDVRQEIAE